jgi:ornithine cyclodeaminase
MPVAIEAVRRGFVGLARGEFEMPARTSLRDGQFLVMSAHHSPTATAMVKTISLNFAGREPAIVGVVAWNDLEHLDHVVADAAAITAIRTAAATGVATDLLARPDSTHLAMIGAGGQALDQVRAVCAVRNIARLTLAARSQRRSRLLAKLIGEEMPHLRVEVAVSVSEAVAHADIVTCATTATSPLFALADLGPDVHVNAVGAFRPTMRELPDELLADAAAVHVDQREAALEESGEVRHALESGAITLDDLVELGHALGETPGGPAARTGRTVFKSVGVAVQDWAIGRLLAHHIRQERTAYEPV